MELWTLINPSHSETISTELLFDTITKITKLALKLFYDVLKETKDSKDFLISKDPILTKNLIPSYYELQRHRVAAVLRKEPVQALLF